MDCIMLVHNVQTLAAHAVLHLLATTPGPIRFVFVDNGSDEPIEPRFRPWLGDHHVYIRHATNQGVYGPTNEALAQCTADLVLWCATDHLVFPGWFPPLAAAIRQEGLAWAAPTWDEGPYGMDELWAALQPVDRYALQLGRLGSSCFLLDWKRLKGTLGGFDDRFRVVYGDSDYLERMHDARLKFGVVHGSRSRHLGHQTCRVLGAEQFTAWERADAAAFAAKYADRPDVLARHTGLAEMLAAPPAEAEARTLANWQQNDPALPTTATVTHLATHDDLLAARALATGATRTELDRLVAHVESREAFADFYGTPTPERTFLPEDRLAVAHQILPRCALLRDRVLAQRGGNVAVLELGCFDGWLLLNLAMSGRVIGHGVDVAEYAIAEATARAERHRLPVTFSTGFAEDVTPGALGRFDAVLIPEVLEHVMDPEAVLTAADRMVVPGGRVYVTVPKTPPPHQHERERREHVRLITEPMLRAWGTAHGRRLVEYVAWNNGDSEAHMLVYEPSKEATGA